jgi:predicted component of type VI protein secretion system
MSEQDHDFVVSDVEYNVITTLATLLQSEDVLAQYTEDARIAGEDKIAQLFLNLRKHHKEVAQGLRAALRENLTP